jgi:BMFP domain-containing protein YqiC
MQTDNRIFDDFARLAGGALNALTGLKTEIENLVRQQFESFLSGMHMVTREEFDAVQAMAARAREEQEAMAVRLAAVEIELAQLRAGGPAPTPRRTRKAKTQATGEQP